jgi:chromosome transmission fidelity protein 18
LLTDEALNYNILKWIKEWDPIVFNNQKDTPFNKILLLSGPPGLGKTTLIHILAKQAGYNAIEINASDERGEAGKQRVIDAASAWSLDSTSKKGKPNLIILDEIDGALGGDNVTFTTIFTLGIHQIPRRLCYCFKPCEIKIQKEKKYPQSPNHLHM